MEVLQWISACSSEGMCCSAGRKPSRDGQGRRGGGVTLCIRGALNTIELTVDNDKVECLWAGIREGPKRLTSWWVSYGPPNQDGEIDELFCKQLEDVSRSPVLVHVGNFNLPNNLLGTQHRGEDAVWEVLEVYGGQLLVTSGELLASQPALGVQQDYGTDHPECDHMAHIVWPKEQTHPGGFWRDMSRLTNVISFYDQVTHLVDEGNAVDVVYMDLSIDTVSHSICLKKLAAHGLDRVLG